MPGPGPENMGVKALAEGILLLHGEVRGRFKEIKELFPDEWSAGAYHRAPALPMPLDAACANITYGNGVPLVTPPASDETRPARLVLKRVTPTHGERKGNAGHPPACLQA